MDSTSFLIGALVGVFLTLVIGALLIIIVNAVCDDNDSPDDPVKYFEQSVSYEGKNQISVKVIQAFDHTALAMEAGDTLSYSGNVIYNGKTVMIIGSDHYTGEIVCINRPQQIGLYTYINQCNVQMTVPVIKQNQI